MGKQMEFKKFWKKLSVSNSPQIGTKINSLDIWFINIFLTILLINFLHYYYQNLNVLVSLL